MILTEIKLARIDFRLMHGQVVTNWIKQVSADSILLVDDELVADKFLAQVFLMAAPPGIKVAIRSIEKATQGFKNNIFNYIIKGLKSNIFYFNFTCYNMKKI